MLVAIPTYSQQDPIADALQYYPLEIGNYWQYEVTKAPFGAIDTTWIGYKEVVGDTIMANGNKYFIIEENELITGVNTRPTYYRRLDSTTSNVYQYKNNLQEEIVDSLLAKEGDKIFYGFNCTSDSSKMFWGSEIDTKFFQDVLISSVSYRGYEYGKGLGETIRRYDDINLYHIGYKATLIYAKIGEEEFGIKTSIKEYNNIPNEFSLSQNYPNPFNPETIINYNLPYSSQVKLVVYDILGNEMVLLVDDNKTAGQYSIELDGSHLSSGVYIYRLISGRASISKKMLLLK